MRSLLTPLVVGLALLIAASSISYSIAKARLAHPYDVPHVPSGRGAKLFALGHRTALSDLYWLSTVQYIGEPRAEERGWDKLLPLVDLVTDLDPRHGYAYQTGGIVLSAAGLLDESDAILKKGLQTGPPYWSFPYYLAFNAWFYRGDYATAARYAEMAAKTPGASPNISQLALSLSAKTGTPEQALILLSELRATVKDEATASRLDDQLKLATLERDAQMLEKMAARYRSERGHPIASLRELITAGYISSLPVDPFGGEYVWRADQGKVRSSANPFRFEFREGGHTPRFQYRPPGAPAPGVLR